jgi:hypothetical protein
MQYALADVETLAIDTAAMERRRDRLCAGREAAGYRVTRPRGSVCALVETPGEKASFCDRLAAADVFVMPGAICGIPGHVRLPLTASDAMVEDALPRFARVAAGLRAAALAAQAALTPRPAPPPRPAPQAGAHPPSRCRNPRSAR